MTVAGVDTDKLRSLVERIERLDEEIAAANEEKAGIYAEAEPEFDKNALKLVVKRRRKARNLVDAEDFMVAQYERALAGWDGTPLGDAASTNGHERQESAPAATSKELVLAPLMLPAPERKVYRLPPPGQAPQ